MNIFLRITLVCLVVLFPQLVIAEEKTRIKVGAILPLSGPAGHIGQSAMRGIELAMLHLDESDEFRGIRLEVISEDSQSEPRLGVNAFNKLVHQDRVDAVLAQLTSIVMSIRPMAERAGIPVLVEGTHPDNTKGFNYVFRHFFTSDTITASAERFINEREFKKVAVLHAEEEWGEAAFNLIKKNLEPSSSEIVRTESFARDEGDLRAQILNIRRAGPELIYVIGLGTPVINAYRQMHELGMDASILGFVICGQSEVMEAAKPYLEGTYSVDMPLPSGVFMAEVLKELNDRKYPGQWIDQSAVYGFDSIMLLAQAAKKGANNREEIKALFSSRDSRFQSTQGVVEFSEEGDAPIETALYTIRDGKCEEL